MPLIIFMILAIGGTSTAMHFAIKEKAELEAHPRTWKGEMLCPPGQEDCNDPNPKVTPTPKEKL